MQSFNTLTAAAKNYTAHSVKLQAALSSTHVNGDMLGDISVVVTVFSAVMSNAIVAICVCNTAEELTHFLTNNKQAQQICNSINKEDLVRAAQQLKEDAVRTYSAT
jgi:hypothetical protein